jgi:hypothetical protein
VRDEKFVSFNGHLSVKGVRLSFALKLRGYSKCFVIPVASQYWQSGSLIHIKQGYFLSLRNRVLVKLVPKPGSKKTVVGKNQRVYSLEFLLGSQVEPEELNENN